MEKKNFEAFTNSKALKQYAIQWCGQEFIDGLIKRSIFAKDTKFWQEVNQYLKIPNDAYEKKIARDKLEKEQKIAEEKAREKAEKERLLANKKQCSDSKERKGWEITVFELPGSDKYGNKFIADCTKKPNLIETTDLSKSYGDAYSRACSFVDKFEKNQDKLECFIDHYQVLKPLYLMIIYLSGRDEYNRYLGNYKNKSCKESFVGITFWNGLDFDILNVLEKEKLLEISDSKKTLTMTREAIIQARKILKEINLDGVEALLKQREHHEEYIYYKSPLDVEEEQE
ncbi:hypothetical protein [Cylindrospermum sp. FACHB-282]|uniref:hypothetical protein n=1 Tax=Cylindrospermum sp. FACHB-282 TaxID=2692794 RepID=UPI0016868143|nr:hypothetical protein [Cylindrospermum sp. FACHB-282]MBD2384505.1 hypothetical protein [Cylindrospermum sp. FACHB-282]